MGRERVEYSKRLSSAAMRMEEACVKVSEGKCTGCGACLVRCKAGALRLVKADGGERYV